MEDILNESRFSFISEQDKIFIIAFSEHMKRMGYDHGGEIGPGYCWGRFMIIYTKSKRCIARIYLREQGIILRLFLNQLDKHQTYLESTPSFIKTVFTDIDKATCKHCHNEKDGVCRFRKSYSIDGKRIEKCNGITFEFLEPNLDKLPYYIDLLSEFYESKHKQRSLSMKST